MAGFSLLEDNETETAEAAAGVAVVVGVDGGARGRVWLVTLSTVGGVLVMPASAGIGTN